MQYEENGKNLRILERVVSKEYYGNINQQEEETQEDQE
jgi:hypothetical protein